MIQVIHCSGCGTDGAMPGTLGFEFNERMCGECHNRKNDEHKLWFHSLQCFRQWVLSRGDVLTLPCWICEGTGNAFGFAENGKCRTCAGASLIGDAQARTKDDSKIAV